MSHLTTHKHRESSYLHAYYLCASKAHSTSVENVRQISPFLQNKPKVKYAKINLNSFMTIKYEKVDNWSNQTNKPNFILDVSSPCFGVYPRVCLPVFLPGVGGQTQFLLGNN